MSSPFAIVKLPAEHQRSVVGVWKIDFPGLWMTRSIEVADGSYYLVSRLLDQAGARVGGEDGLLLQKISQSEYRGTGPNQSTYKVDPNGKFEQYIVGDREPSMVGQATKHPWPDEA